MPRGSFIVAAGSVLAFAASGAAQEEAGAGRPPFDRMERALAAAVAGVSRPAAVPGIGAADVCRGYRLRGVGAWFVISPRFFPEHTATRSRQDPELMQADRALSDAIQGLARGVTAAHSEHERQVIRGGIQQLQDKRRDLRARAHAASERERELAAWQARAEAMHQAAEEARLEAERAFAMLEKTLGRPLQPNEGLDAARRAIAEDPTPPLPPWRIWIQPNMPEETRSPDAVLQDVRQAILKAIEDEGAALPLSNDEVIAVAVDFFRPTVSCNTPPARTLVLRAPKRVLDAKAAGTLDAEAARQQIEIQEY